MSISSISLARVSNLLQSDTALASVNKTQQDLLEVQNQIATGKRVNTASDDPGAAAIIQQLQSTLTQRQAYATNLQNANSQLGEVDSTLGDLSNLLQQAQSVASQNVGSDVTPDQRKGAAAVVSSLMDQALSIGNKQFEGIYLFAGDRSNQPPFTTQNGQIKYVGSQNLLNNSYDNGLVIPFQVDGNQVFGALTTQVIGTTNLAPNITATTRLIDLKGATGEGVHPGTIRIGNGVTTADVDLSKADSIGDIASAINTAAIPGVTASVGSSGLVLSGAGNISVNDISGGNTAADLGILTPIAAGAGVPINGQNLAAQITPLTRISDLRGGGGLDPSGLTITNGGAPVSISFTGAATVEDALNAINGSKAGVLARINSAGTGIDVVNPTQGSALTISENGGNTAAQLGVRSFNAATNLKDLNGGLGVRTVPGADLKITRRDGSNFSVDVDGSNTVQDVINAINTADAGGGVTASFATGGNGIVLTDSTVGGTLSVSPVGGSSAASDLGLLNPASGNTITGGDVNPVVSTGIFSQLAKLRASLQSSDQAGITAAAQGLADSYTRVVAVRGATGARVQELQSRQTQLDDENVATKSLLSDLQDTDLSTAITRFQTLQTALQANYLTAAKVLHLSLLDFLT